MCVLCMSLLETFFVVEMGYYGGVNVADATGIGLIQCCYVEGTKYQVPGGTVCCQDGLWVEELCHGPATDVG